MVQVFNLPQSTQGRLSEQLGQALGQGVSRNFPQPEMMVERQMQQSALADFKKNLTGKESPSDLLLAWGNTMAGVPNSDRLSQMILPQLVRESMFRSMYNNEPQLGGVPQGGGQPQGEGQFSIPTLADPVPGMMPNQGGMVPNQGGMPQTQQQYPDQSSLGGILPNTREPSKSPIQQGGLLGQDLMTAQMLGLNPKEYLEYKSGIPLQEIANKQEALAQKRASNLATFAKERLGEGVSADDLNTFLRIGSKYQGMAPEDWFARTNVDFKKFNTAKTAFERADIPNYRSMFESRASREKSIKNLRASAQPLIEAGMEDYVRERLSKHWLSPTEIESIVRPPSEGLLNSSKNLPSVPKPPASYSMFDDNYSYDKLQEINPGLVKDMNNKYVDYLVNNVTPSDSLLVIRDQLRNEKNMGWEQFYDIVQQAQGKGLKLSIDQLNEMPELTMGYRDSLPHIFKSAGSIIDILKGVK